MGGRSRILIIALGAIALVVAGYQISALPKMGHIQLPAEKIGEIGGYPIVNTMIATWITMILLVVLSWLATRQMQEVPGRLQNLLEMVMEAWLGLVDSVAGVGRGRRFLTIVTSIFLFVLVNNWLGLFPFFGSLGIWEAPKTGGEAVHQVEAVKPETEAVKHETAPSPEAQAEAAGAEESGPTLVPLLRSASTDLNTTLALALVSVVLTQVYGMQHLGIGSYIGKFLNFKGGPIGLFVGLLEGVGEVAKIISLSFRLFGNMFAGEVLLATMAFLVPWVAAVPFMGLEMFVGFMQAFIFAMLTLVFMTVATTPHEHEAHAESHH